MVIAADDFAYISAFIREHSAIVLEPGKEYLVDARLSPIIREIGLPSLAALVTELKKRPLNGLHAKVVEAMTTNETSFFRDITPFDGMRQQVLPELITRRSAERRLRIWCGAASSGQEPYSLAMLILEHFPALASWDVKIIATDISRDILRRAKEGRYSVLEANRGLPAPMLVKYFERAGLQWSVKDSVRALVQFEEMNLIRPWKVLPMCDVVFMRNVLIYFDMSTKATILARIRDVLRPGGYLFLGSAETTINIDPKFIRVPLGKASCYTTAA
jgi:chemotaxis protein methyltransferase CheR